MKTLEDPVLESWGMNYLPNMTKEFKDLVNNAKEKIWPFVTKEVCYTKVYFEVRSEQVSSEFDCCDNEKCIEKSKKDIRKEYGKGTHVKEIWMQNDGDQDRIDLCSQCGIPLNEFMTWCEDELEWLEEQEWDHKLIIEEAFLIHAILQSQPSLDNNISGYAKHQGGEKLEKAIVRREEFFQRIVRLAEFVMDANLPSEVPQS